MRMTRRVKPPTAAVTMTNTWPWSDAMSDAEVRGEWRMAGRREKMYSQAEEMKRKRRQRRRMAKENCGRRESRRRKREGEIKCKEQVRMIIVSMEKRNME